MIDVPLALSRAAVRALSAVIASSREVPMQFLEPLIELATHELCRFRKLSLVIEAHRSGVVGVVGPFGIVEAGDA